MKPRERMRIALAVECSEATVRRWEKDPTKVHENSRQRIEQAVQTLGVKPVRATRKGEQR